MLGVFLDIETSGLDPFRHEPLEIAFIIADLLRKKELAHYESLLQISPEEWGHRDLESSKVNCISLEMLSFGKKRVHVAKEIEEILLEYSITNKRAFFICQNPSFDRPFFSKIISPGRQKLLDFPYHWLDLASMYFAKKLVYDQEQQEFSLEISKDAIAAALALPPEEHPHRAMNGVRHLYLCYSNLLEKALRF